MLDGVCGLLSVQVGRAGHMTATGSAGHMTATGSAGHMAATGSTGHMTAKGSAVTFVNNSNKSVFLVFSDLMVRLGVALPPQLTSSPHLALQREQRKRLAVRTPQTPAKKAKKLAAHWEARL